MHEGGGLLKSKIKGGVHGGPGQNHVEMIGKEFLTPAWSPLKEGALTKNAVSLTHVCTK